MVYTVGLDWSRLGMFRDRLEGCGAVDEEPNTG